MKNYIAFDIASEVSVVCVMNESGKIVMPSTPVPTNTESLKQVVKGFRHPRIVTFEECSQAAWLYSVLSPVADDVLVCDPKKNYHLSGDNKSDKMDAYNLCDRLRSGVLKRVWHGGDRVESLRQLAHSYQELTKDSTRLKLRLKALFRSRGIQVSDELYDSKMQGELIAKLPIAEQRTRALHLADLLERVTQRREQAYKDMVRLASRDKMYQAVISIPQFGEVFTSLFIATVCTPHRFRTRGQFCSYAGFAVSTYESSEYELDPRGRACKKSRKVRTRGLTKSFNRTLKYIFNSAAVALKSRDWKEPYQAMIDAGVSPDHARLTLARKLAAITLHIAKTGEMYDKNIAFPMKQISIVASDQTS